MHLIQCLPFYHGYLKIIFSGHVVSSIEYIEKQCLYSFDSQNPFIKKLMRYSKGYPVNFSDVEIKYVYGTSFERRVWDIVRLIPYGEVKTYKWVAEELGNKSLSRAVGNALGKNPLLLIVPCHRVIRSNGELGGFSSVGGLELKRFLLKLEKIL